LRGGVDDFEKKFPASPCQKKNIACSTNEIEKNSCTAASKKKNVAKLFHHFRGTLQNPSKTATILPLLPLNSGVGYASECAMHS